LSMDIKIPISNLTTDTPLPLNPSVTSLTNRFLPNNDACHCSIHTGYSRGVQQDEL
jgi:hypothetical protein